MEPYERAQRALADLKIAVYDLLRRSGGAGLTNSEIGRALGIYAGHIGHTGHISRTVLELLKSDGVAYQDQQSKKWFPKLIAPEDNDQE